LVRAQPPHDDADRHNDRAGGPEECHGDLEAAFDAHDEASPWPGEERVVRAASVNLREIEHVVFVEQVLDRQPEGAHLSREAESKICERVPTELPTTCGRPQSFHVAFSQCRDLQPGGHPSLRLALDEHVHTAR
jgi:hypothetical protein